MGSGRQASDHRPSDRRTGVTAPATDRPRTTAPAADVPRSPPQQPTYRGHRPSDRQASGHPCSDRRAGATPCGDRALPGRRRPRPAGAASRDEAAQPQFRGGEVGQAVQGEGFPLGGGAQGFAYDAGLDQTRVGEQRGVEEGDQFGQRCAQAGPGDGGRGGLGGGAPARRQLVDARTRKDPAQDRRAGARLDPEGFGERAGGPYDLVVQEGGVQPLAADLGGLFQDAVVEAACRARAARARASPGRWTEVGRIAAS